jgi:hypothetical protein
MALVSEDDFAGYVGARWPSLVRTLVLLGCPVDDAPDVVATGLARCRRGWREAAEHDDLDVVVHRAILDAWSERLRGRWWDGLRPRRDDDWPLPDLSVLDRLTPEVRTGLVLRRFAALDPAQAVGVAGREAGGPLPAVPDGPTLRAAGDSVVVFAPPDDQLLASNGGRGPRRRLAVIAGIVAIVLALVGWSVVVSERDEPVEGDDPLGLVEPSRSRNPAGVAWYASDVLHLANATYVVPLLRDLAVLGSGAVYGDDDGRVVHLFDDGVRILLGTKDPAVRLVASSKLGWVAWVDQSRARPHLVVYDVGREGVIGDMELPPSDSGPQEEPDTQPIAIDQETVYFTTSEGARAWPLARDPGYVDTIEQAGLSDVASANRVFQHDAETIQLDQPFFNAAPIVPGRGGELSDDGQFVLTHSPVDGSLLVYDFDSAELLDVRPPDDVTVVDAVLAPLGAVTYLTVDPDGFAQQEGNDSSPLKGELVTCQLDDGACESLATFVLDSEAPILAR